MASESENAAATPAPPARPTLSTNNRAMARLWVEVKKAAIPAIVTGVLGYGGGLIIPPTAIYDWVVRQDPNDLSGRWFSAAAGSQAELWLTDKDRLLKGRLIFRGKTYTVEGNHDSEVVLEAPFDGNQTLKIGLSRKVGERYGPDDGFLLLTPDDNARKMHTAILVCVNDAMDSSKKENCRPLGDGISFFARERGDPR